MKPSAWNLTRTATYYRHEAFTDGLRAAGYEVREGEPADCKRGDVLLIWNRYGRFHDLATRFEASGGTVVVAENGYLRGPKDGGDYYALARHGHNGSGWTPSGDPERFEALGIALKPWRETGSHILVAPNRCFGMPGLAMPPDWASGVRARLEKTTRREIRIRPHPGNGAPPKPLAEDLAGAWCVVIWASSAGVHALIQGVPVICDSPFWICKDAALPLDAYGLAIDHEAAFGTVGATICREIAMERLAWAQWSLAEIQSGDAFDHLLLRT